MNKRKILENSIIDASNKVWSRLQGQDTLNMSEAIEFLKELGFSDITQKMMRDLDSIINPLKKDSGYRAFGFESLNRAQIVLALKAVGLSNKKIKYLFEKRMEIVGLIHKLKLDVNNMNIRELGDKDVAYELDRKVNEYLLMLNQVISHNIDMERVIRISRDFFNDENERTRAMLK